jgi:regulator of replication initiation timing
MKNRLFTTLSVLLFSCFLSAQGPQNWNPNKSYTHPALVINGSTTYLSLRDVPSSTSITDMGYWSTLDSMVPTDTPTGSDSLTTPDVSELEKLTVPDNDTNESNIEKGLIAWYPMNGTSEDVSGNGFNGVVNGATLTKDRFGNLEAAFSFDGKDDYLEIPNFDWNERNDCTISLWTKYQKLPEDLGKDYGMIFGMNNESHSLFLHSGKLYFRQGWGNGSINAPTLGTWHNLVLTWNGSLKKVTFYQNSKKVSEHNAYQQVGLKKGTLRIGANDRILNYFFKGSIDDFRIYDRALNADEVLALFELESKPPTDDNPPSPPSNDPGTPPADDYLETIAALQQQIEQLSAELNDAKEEISLKDETITELQSTNQELTYENEELRGELAEEVEKNDVLTAQVANLTQDNNNLKYELGVATKQAEEAVKMAQVPFINGWVYDNDRGWIFTDADHYPLVYTHKTDTWHYFELGSNPRYFFNFKSQQWESWDNISEKNDASLANKDNL